MRATMGQRWSFPAVKEAHRQGGLRSIGVSHIFFNEQARDAFLKEKREDPVSGSDWLWEPIEFLSVHPFVPINYGARPGLPSSPYYRVHSQSQGAMVIGSVPSETGNGQVRAYTMTAYKEQAKEYLMKRFLNL